MGIEGEQELLRGLGLRAMVGGAGGLPITAIRGTSDPRFFKDLNAIRT